MIQIVPAPGQVLERSNVQTDTGSTSSMGSDDGNSLFRPDFTP